MDLKRETTQSSDLLLVLLGFKDLEQSKLLSGETSKDQSSGGDGGSGSASSSQDETSSSGEGGSAQGVQEEDRLGHGHADQAHGQGDSEKALWSKLTLDEVKLEKMLLTITFIVKLLVYSFVSND